MKDATREPGSLRKLPVSLADFPDPYRQFEHPLLDTQRSSIRHVRYHQRRSGIFAEARYLLARMGPGRFSVRRLAERCELTTQSIYNLVGNRTQIIISAMQDHTDAVLRAAENSEINQHSVLAIDELYLSIAELRPDFISSAIKAMFGEEPELRQGLYTFGWQIREKCLIQMRAGGQLLPDADCTFLAQQLTLNGCASSYEWSQGFYDLDQHRTRHRWGTAALLYRFLTETERSKLAPFLDSHGRVPNLGEPWRIGVMSHTNRPSENALN